MPHRLPDTARELLDGEPSDAAETRNVNNVAILVASKDGERTIGETVASAVRQGVDVYVVSDGSTDGTAAVSSAAGARILELETNVGKPAALYKACHDLGLLENYDVLAILDDDTRLSDDFMAKTLARFNDDTAIVVGRTVTDWREDQKWNLWVGYRAYSYWRYQLLLRRGQSSVNALNCISGSNSVYRTSVLRQVLVPDNPYIVDDTYWTLEVQRRKLGRITYEPSAHAFIQDPTSLRDWYKQNLRWMWGTFQGVRGHQVGRKCTWFDFNYVCLMLDWFLYVVVSPVLLVFVLMDFTPRFFALYVSGYVLWSYVAAIALRKWRLIFLSPLFIAVDWVYRVNFVHAAIKTWRIPTVTDCRWESPKRADALIPAPAQRVPAKADAL